MNPEVGEFLSLVVQIAGLTAVAPLTLLCRRKRWAWVVGPALGIVVNIVGQIVLAGGGPGACVGFFAFPLYGGLISWLTLKFAAWRNWQMER